MLRDFAVILNKIILSQLRAYDSNYLQNYPKKFLLLKTCFASVSVPSKRALLPNSAQDPSTQAQLQSLTQTLQGCGKAPLMKDQTKLIIIT